MNDDNNLALNQEAETTSPDTSPVVEEKVSEQEVLQNTEQSKSVEQEQPESEEGSNKKGFANRVRELNARAKQAEDKARSLEAKLAELTGNTPETVPQIPDYADEPLVKPGEEIDTLELDKRLREREQRILARADAMVTLRSKQSEAITRINNEAAEVMRTHPELNPDSDSFNRELSDTVTEAVEAYVKANPYTASVKNFANRLMKQYQKSVTSEVGKVTETIAKQVSESALKPTSIRKPEKSAEEMSLAELEAKLGIVTN